MQMQIVIDILEQDYVYIAKKHCLPSCDDRTLRKKIYEMIANGTPLPKGHGRLIEQPTDADIAETIGGQNDFADCIREAVATVFENVKTVIEADGGAE